MTRQALAGVAATVWIATGLVLLTGVRAGAAGINTNTGLMPREGGSLFRLQFRYADIEHDPSPANRRIRSYAVPLTFIQ